MEKKTDPKTWGRFQLVELLGKGGMGNVYKAYDPDLKRHIALKILRHEDPEVVKRFLREARAQAQVEHMHVCKVYESGKYGGHPYIAMQYIEGDNLRALREELTLEEKIKIMKEVALGLHAAHHQGLIHRDVKPANVMIKQTEDGHWKPYIMDFGIAREQEAPGLTSTGMVVGTPYYMSPEHARGKLKSLDRRSDIYSLGVTLYELLTGSVPFEGDTPVDILMKVIQKDAQPLRKINPRVPMDIETIVMKCLEKEPHRRYASAKELAEDLQRYLDGDPIEARPATITYRIRRKLTKHRVPVLVVGTAVVLIAVLLGLWLKTKYTASQRAFIAQQLGQEVEKIENTMRYANILPLHSIAGAKNRIRLQIKGIEKKMAEVGAMGLGPGHYAIGRGYLALQEYDKAKEHLEKAWEAGHRTAEVAYKRGLVLGELYLKENEKAERISNKEMREARKKEVEGTFRERALFFLRQGVGARDESPGYIEAQIGFYEKDFDRALTVLQGIVGKNGSDIPGLYKAKVLEGNIYLAMGLAKNNYEEALEYFTKAEKAYRQVIEIGKSDIRGYRGLGRVLERKINIKINSKGGDVEPLVQAAIDCCQKALKIDPGLPEIHVMLSSVHRLFGRHKVFCGQDPIENFDRSVAAAENAIALQPENFEAYTIIGINNRLKGEYLLNHGQDPTVAFSTAVKNFEQAIKLHPNHVMAFNGSGNVYTRMAQYLKSQGKDATLMLDRAVASFEKALAINPKLVNLYNGLAGALWVQGMALMADGQDPRPSFEKAAASLEKAIEFNPGFVHLYTNLGFVLLEIGRYELDYGFVPTETANRAVGYFEKAVKINPRGNELYLGLVKVSGILIHYDFLLGRNCSPRVKKAAGYFRSGIEVNPNDVRIYTGMAASYIVQARYLLDRQRSPAQALRQAEELLKKARALNPNSFEVYGQDGDVSLLKARWKGAVGEDPRPYFRAAQGALQKAAQLNPKDIQVQLIRIRLYWRQAEWEILSSRTAEAEQTTAAGLAVLEKALAVNSNYAELHALQGVLLHLRAGLAADERTRLSTQVQARLALLKGMKGNKNLRNFYAPYLQKAR